MSEITSETVETNTVPMNALVHVVHPPAQEIEEISELYGIRWTTRMVFLLISLYEQHKEEFNSFHTKKKQVWKTIAIGMCQKGYEVTADQCDSKWRSLKKTYRKMIAPNSFNNGHRSWQFFEAMHIIHGRTLQLKRVLPPVIKSEKLEIFSELIETIPSLDSLNKDHSDHTSDSESPEANGFVWTSQITYLLITLYHKYKEVLTSTPSKKKEAWTVICNCMAYSGYDLTSEQCEKKWQNLRKTYNLLADQNNSTSVNIKSNWQYFDVMHTMLEKSSEPYPVPTVSSCSTGLMNTALLAIEAPPVPSSSSSHHNGYMNDTESDTGTHFTGIKRKIDFSNEPFWFKTYLDQRKKHHNDIMERHRINEENRQNFRQKVLQLLQTISNNDKSNE